MTFPAVQATNTSSEDVATASHTVSLPTSIISGDLLIVIFSVDLSTVAITWPGGWTEFFSDTGPGAQKVAIAYRQADGGEGASITVTTDSTQRSGHNSYRINNHENPATQSPEVSARAIGTNSNPDPPSLTPTGGVKDYLWLAVTGHTATTTNNAPSSYTNLLNVGNAAIVTGSARRQLNAASENPGTFTIANPAQWLAVVIVIHPVSVGSKDYKSSLRGVNRGVLRGVA